MSFLQFHNQDLVENPYNFSIPNAAVSIEDENHETGYSPFILDLANTHAPSSGLVLVRVFRCFWVASLSSSAVSDGFTFDSNFMNNLKSVTGINNPCDVTDELLQFSSDLTEKQILEELRVAFIPHSELVPF